MGRIKLNIEPIYLIFMFFCTYFGYLKQLVIYSVVLILHELAHIVVAKSFGYDFKEIKLNYFGAEAKTKSKFLEKHEFIIAFAGPLFNLIMVVLFMALWWIFPSLYLKTELFVQANFALAIFNLLPIFPLDAGRMLFVKLKSKVKKRNAIVIIKINSFFAIIGLSILFFISVFNSINLNYLFIISFILMSLNFEDLKGDTLSFLEKKDKKFLEVKSFITKETDLSVLISKLNSTCFSQFYIIDEKGKIVNKITETELINKFIKIK